MKKIIVIIAMAFCLNTNAQYTRLYSFGTTPDGSNPVGNLITDGTFLYGMTEFGGTGNVGTIFKIMPNGTGYVKLHDFGSGSDGAMPQGSLVYDGSTYLYGMTSEGGTNNKGMIFKIKPNGTGYDTLLNFNGTNGNNPTGSLYYTTNLLYGMTSEGGTGTCSTTGCGTMFKIAPNGSGFTTLVNFAGATNGRYPQGSFWYNGSNLFGMTSGGGANSDGTIFNDLPNYVKLYDFTGTTGKNPSGSLIQAGTPALYGMAAGGGANSVGNIFEINQNGTGYSDIFDFTGANGSNPSGSLIYDGVSLLYGMTPSGGANNMGTVFKIMPNGTGYDTLFNFNNTNGNNPTGSLLLIDSCLYGVASQGGVNSNGVIFRYCIPSTAGIQQVTSINNQISIYPNPSNGSFTIETNATTKQTIQIYDVNGQTVLSQSINGKATTTMIDVTSLNEGIYNISIISNEGVINKRVVIVK
jgi:uncharacterized repeat protein (TIGR03803 family)